ncbi:hypothetical protein JCM8547_008846 [Rhodosporidiobolus lusitaniae]
MADTPVTTPPDPSPEGLRRRSAPASDNASPSLVPLSPPLQASSSSSAVEAGETSPLFRPVFSRTSTDSGDSSSPSSSSSSSSSGTGSPRFVLRDSDDDPLFSGLSLLSLLSTLDAHVELFTRPLRRKSVSWREKADKLLDEAKARAVAGGLGEFKLKVPLPDVPAFDLNGGIGERKVLSQKDRERLERKFREVREKTRGSVQKLVVKWEEEKTVRLRDKISFLCGVMNVLITALLLGFEPTWVPSWYSVQMLFYTPFRIYTYKNKNYHYFLFDLCYAVNLLCLIYLWVLPGNAILFEACYGLTLGSLGTAIATWRNSLVFHSLDKVISLAIHIFPPLVFTVIRHFYPRDVALERYPALKQLEHIRPWRSMAICMAFYTLWQLLYFHFVIQLRADKIKEGRATSFTYMVNDKKRLIGKIAAKVPQQWREAAFMAGQALYTFVTLLIPLFVLYDSKFWSCVYLLWLFMTSAWNGASFYMEVFSRRFERELLSLRKEFDAQQALLSRYAANPSAPTPGIGLTADPLSERGQSLAGEGEKELQRSASGPPKMAEDREVGSDKPLRKEEKKEGNKKTVQEELGRVEKPKTAA